MAATSVPQEGRKFDRVRGRPSPRARKGRDTCRPAPTRRKCKPRSGPPAFTWSSRQAAPVGTASIAVLIHLHEQHPFAVRRETRAILFGRPIDVAGLGATFERGDDDHAAALADAVEVSSRQRTPVEIPLHGLPRVRVHFRRRTRRNVGSLDDPHPGNPGQLLLGTETRRGHLGQYPAWPQWYD